jgi:predicted enzyme related to lactoylglutathione lyase
MDLAKPALDVGLYTNQLEQMLAFWKPYAAYDELLKLGGGAHQHRHKIGDSILKINHARIPTPQGMPTGLSALSVYTDSVAPGLYLDPDDNQLKVHSSEGDRNLSLNITCSDVGRSAEFYGQSMGLPGATDHHFNVGASSIILSEGSVGDFKRAGIGFRYMTVQVFDVVATHAEILAKGGREGMAPTKLGDVAFISFVLDPDGNWIEISQRKSLTGSLD